MTSRRALILDVGGVLTTPVRGSFQAFCTSEGVELDDLLGVVRELFDMSSDDHPIVHLETGRMEVAAFDAWLANELNTSFGTQIAVDGVARRLVSNVALEDRMLDVVRRARASKVPTALLSNSWGNTDYPEAITELFDTVVISGVVGLRKPDAAIYLLTAERVGAEPSECVFVDDVRRNCDGATAVGMHAILHTDPDETIPELESLLGVALR